MKRVIALLCVALVISGSVGVMAQWDGGGAVPMYKHVGVSSDAKPATGTEGDTFLETDSGFLYIWNGSAWVLTNTASISAGLVLVRIDTITTTGAKAVVGNISGGGYQFTGLVKTDNASTDSLIFALQHKYATGIWSRPSNSTLFIGGFAGALPDSIANADYINNTPPGAYGVAGADSARIMVYKITASDTLLLWLFTKRTSR